MVRLVGDMLHLSVFVDDYTTGLRPDGLFLASSDATNFALESLSLAGENFANSDRVRRACGFLLKKQMDDGGWGETYMVSLSSFRFPSSFSYSRPVRQSCVTGVYCQHSSSQVVQTAWAVLSLISAKYPRREPIDRAVKLIMNRQLEVRVSRPLDEPRADEKELAGRKLGPRGHRGHLREWKLLQADTFSSAADVAADLTSRVAEQELCGASPTRCCMTRIPLTSSDPVHPSPFARSSTRM